MRPFPYAWRSKDSFPGPGDTPKQVEYREALRIHQNQTRSAAKWAHGSGRHDVFGTGLIPAQRAGLADALAGSNLVEQIAITGPQTGRQNSLIDNNLIEEPK